MTAETLAAVQDGNVAEPPRELSLVDCDVHPLVHDMTDIARRMSTRAARRINLVGNAGVPGREPNRVLHPTGPLRHDAVPPGGGPAGSDPAFARDQWLDRYDVSAAILVPIQAAAVVTWADETVVGEYLSAINDHLLERWTGLDARFRVAVSVSPHDGDTAVREVERLAGVPGVAAVNFPLADVSPGRPAFYKLFEACEEHGLPLLMHPTGSEGNFASAPTFAGGIVRTYPEHHAMLGQSGHAATASMVLSGTLQRFPRLKLVLAEFGCSWAGPLMWRMDTAWERHGHQDLEMPPSEYVVRQVRFTTQPFDEPREPRRVAAVLEEIQAEKTLLFSSDYPHWDTDDPAVILKSRIPAALRDRVATQTAIETFGERLWL
jgi:uncharacterized protein